MKYPFTASRYGSTREIQRAHDWQRSRTLRAARRLRNIMENYGWGHRPKSRLTRKVLLTKIRGNLNVLHVAAAKCELCIIPKRFLNQRNLRSWSGPCGNVFHLVAATGRLCDIPPHLLTIENMTIRNGSGETPLHLAARAQDVSYIPRSLLTTPLLMLVDNDGNTALHEAAKGRGLIQIPWQVQTAINFAVKNNDHENVLHFAAGSKTLKYLKQPQAVMTANNLLARARYNDTPLETALLTGDLAEIPPSPDLVGHFKEIAAKVREGLRKHNLGPQCARHKAAKTWLAELIKFSLRLPPPQEPSPELME